MHVEGWRPGLGGLELRGLVVDDPDGEAPLFEAGQAEFRVRWWSLLRGRLHGTLAVDDFDLRIRKRGASTNLHGMRRHRSGRRRLDLKLALTGGRVVYRDADRGESLEVRGVGLGGRVTTEAQAREVVLRASAQALVLGGAAVRDLELRVRSREGSVVFERVRAKLTDGAIAAAGSLALEPEGTWSIEFQGDHLGLTHDLLPWLAMAFPPAAGWYALPEGRIAGALSVSGSVTGRGLKWASISESIAGRVRLGLDGVELPPQTLAVRLAALAGRPATPLALPPLELTVAVDRGWLRVESLVAGGRSLAVPFEGAVSVNGELDLSIDVLPLLGTEARAEVQRYARSLPVRVGGTVSAPRLRPPTARSMAWSLVGGWIGRSLDGSSDPTSIQPDVDVPPPRR